MKKSWNWSGCLWRNTDDKSSTDRRGPGCLQGLQKQFPGFELNVSLRVPADTIVGLVGLNGSGKTTLFRLLTGLIRADGGSAQVLEAEIDGLPVSRKEEIGVVMADAGFPGMFTVKEVRKCLGAFYEAFDPGFFDELVKRFGIPAGKSWIPFPRA